MKKNHLLGWSFVLSARSLSRQGLPLNGCFCLQGGKPALMQKCVEVLQQVVALPQASPFANPVSTFI